MTVLGARTTTRSLCNSTSVSALTPPIPIDPGSKGMTMLKRILTIAMTVTGAALATPAQAKLTVVTTIPDLRALASEVGGAHVDVDSIAKGTQDPHYIEAKPS